MMHQIGLLLPEASRNLPANAANPAADAEAWKGSEIIGVPVPRLAVAAGLNLTLPHTALPIRRYRATNVPALLIMPDMVGVHGIHAPEKASGSHPAPFHRSMPTPLASPVESRSSPTAKPASASASPAMSRRIPSKCEAARRLS